MQHGQAHMLGQSVDTRSRPMQELRMWLDQRRYQQIAEYPRALALLTDQFEIVSRLYTTAKTSSNSVLK